MRHVVSLAVLSMVLVVCGATQAADDPVKNGQSPSLWMKKKLDYSQEILAGITVADFDQVTAAASQIRTLNKIESFVKARNPAYREQLKAFQEANEEILQKAEAKDVDGAGAAFSKMTTSCIRCHKVLRDLDGK